MTTSDVPDVAQALAAQLAELGEFLAVLTDADWDRPSPCEGWSVSDVVLHLAQTNEMAIASVDGRYDEVVGSMRAGATVQNVDEGAWRSTSNAGGPPRRSSPAGAPAPTRCGTRSPPPTPTGG